MASNGGAVGRQPAGRAAPGSRGPRRARRLPAHLAFPGALVQSLVLDTTRIRRELGYAEVVSPAEALARTIAWERAHPPAGPDQRTAEYAAEDAALTRYAGALRASPGGASAAHGGLAPDVAVSNLAHLVLSITSKP